MSDFWNRVQGIQQQQSALAIARQDASIAKASDFLARLDGIKTLDNKLHSARNEIALNSGNDPSAQPPVGIVHGNDPVNETPKFVPSRSGSLTAKDYSGSSVSPQTIDYLNADLAKYYGMSRATAYQEALENTSYQRAMADMKAAGLNPSVMFGSGRAHAAGSVGYVSERSSGSGGGYSRRFGKSSGNGKLFSASAYGALSTIGGLVGIAATGRPDGFWIGSQTAQGAMNLMNAFHEAK